MGSRVYFSRKQKTKLKYRGFQHDVLRANENSRFFATWCVATVMATIMFILAAHVVQGKSCLLRSEPTNKKSSSGSNGFNQNNTAVSAAWCCCDDDDDDGNVMMTWDTHAHTHSVPAAGGGKHMAAEMPKWRDRSMTCWRLACVVRAATHTCSPVTQRRPLVHDNVSIAQQHFKARFAKEVSWKCYLQHPEFVRFFFTNFITMHSYIWQVFQKQAGLMWCLKWYTYYNITVKLFV